MKMNYNIRPKERREILYTTQPPQNPARDTLLHPTHFHPYLANSCPVTNINPRNRRHWPERRRNNGVGIVVGVLNGESPRLYSSYSRIWCSHSKAMCRRRVSIWEEVRMTCRYTRHHSHISPASDGHEGLEGYRLPEALNRNYHVRKWVMFSDSPYKCSV